MCSRNLMGGAGEKIDVVAGAMLRSQTTFTRETRLFGEIEGMATSRRSYLDAAGQ